MANAIADLQQHEAEPVARNCQHYGLQFKSATDQCLPDQNDSCSSKSATMC